MRLWNDKPYHSLDYELKTQFGEKVYRLALNGGMTCPNRDGTVGHGGCIFCSGGGSGEFASDPALSIREQIESGKERLSHKRPVNKYIAYFQAFTNTYAPVDYLRTIFGCRQSGRVAMDNNTTWGWVMASVKIVRR